MSWRRARAKGGPFLKPFHKYSSLKVGDTVMSMRGRDELCTLVSIRRFKQVYVNGEVKQRIYWKKGTFLNLVTAELFELDLIDRGVRSEIVRAT